MAINWARALGGAGAGLQGKLPAYLAVEESRDRGRRDEDELRREAIARDQRGTLLYMQAGNHEAAKTLVGRNIQALERLGEDPSASMRVLEMINDPAMHNDLLTKLKTRDEINVGTGLLDPLQKDTYSVSGGQVITTPVGGGPPTASPLEGYDPTLGASGSQFGGQQTFKDRDGNLFFGTTRRSPQTGQVESVLAPIGHKNPMAGSLEMVGSYGETASEATQRAGATEAAKTSAKLKTEFKLKPRVEAAVREAVAMVTADADIAEEARSNQTALQSYDAAMQNLASALGGTETGFFAGMVPTLTPESQIAQGAVAVMAPVLKSIFRTSGEGTFTDNDQKMLMEMIPTRRDSPKARVAKIQMIDTVVRSKLGGPVTQGQQPTGAPGPGTTPVAGGVKFLGFE